MPAPEVLDRPQQGGTESARAARAALTEPTPLQILQTDIPKQTMATIAPFYRIGIQSGLPHDVIKAAVNNSVAAAMQPDAKIDAVRQGFDEQAYHPAIRSRVQTVGTLADIQDAAPTDRNAGSDSRVRSEVAVRGTLFDVTELLNSMNGKGPKGDARTDIENRAAVLAADIFTAAYPREIAIDEPSKEQLAATIGATMDLGNPYNQSIVEHSMDFFADHRAIGSEAVAIRTKTLYRLPNASFKVSADSLETTK